MNFPLICEGATKYIHYHTSRDTIENVDIEISKEFVKLNSIGILYLSEFF
jgi:hypothetical protein